MTQAEYVNGSGNGAAAPLLHPSTSPVPYHLPPADQTMAGVGVGMGMGMGMGMGGTTSPPAAYHSSPLSQAQAQAQSQSPQKLYDPNDPSTFPPSPMASLPSQQHSFVGYQQQPQPQQVVSPYGGSEANLATAGVGGYRGVAEV